MGRRLRDLPGRCGGKRSLAISSWSHHPSPTAVGHGGDPPPRRAGRRPPGSNLPKKSGSFSMDCRDRDAGTRFPDAVPADNPDVGMEPNARNRSNHTPCSIVASPERGVCRRIRRSCRSTAPRRGWVGSTFLTKGGQAFLPAITRQDCLAPLGRTRAWRIIPASFFLLIPSLDRHSPEMS